MRVGAVQDAPVYLDLAATVEKTIALIDDAARDGVQVLGFPEGFVPGHPGWLPVPRNRMLPRTLFENSLEIDGPEVGAIAAACRRGNVAVVLGACERIHATTGTLYNSQLFIDETGRLSRDHQKYVPTNLERLVHAPGRTGTANSMTAHGQTVTGLICGENGNPLALYATSLAYPVVHVAAWPQHFGSGANLRHVVDISSRSVAHMLRTFVLNAVTLVSDEMVDLYGEEIDLDWLRSDEAAPHAGIVSPGGEIIAKSEGLGPQIVSVDIDPGDVILPKFSTDVAGHYNRPELFAPLFAA